MCLFQQSINIHTTQYTIHTANDNTLQKKQMDRIYFFFMTAAPAPSNTARNTGTGVSGAFVVGIGMTGTAVGGVVNSVGVGVGEVMASVGTSTEECISGLSVYIAWLLLATREVVDFFK